MLPFDQEAGALLKQSRIRSCLIEKLTTMQGLSATIEGMLQEVRQKWQDSQQQAGALDSFRAFTAAVDWTVRSLSSSCTCEAWPQSHQQARQQALISARTRQSTLTWRSLAVQEPWLIALLIAEAALLLSVVILRRRSGFLGTVLICSGNTDLATPAHSEVLMLHSPDTVPA